MTILKNEFELEQFRKKLVDRFGNIPVVTAELLETIRLRWLARDIGIEKLFLKNKKMVCYFISNEDSPYYQTAKFTKVLRFVQKNQYTVKMEEKNKRLTLSFTEIKSFGFVFAVLAN